MRWIGKNSAFHSWYYDRKCMTFVEMGWRQVGIQVWMEAGHSPVTIYNNMLPAAAASSHCIYSTAAGSACSHFSIYCHKTIFAVCCTTLLYPSCFCNIKLSSQITRSQVLCLAWVVNCHHAKCIILIVSPQCQGCSECLSQDDLPVSPDKVL